MYRAFVKKEGPVTTGEILAIHEALSKEIYGKPVEVQVRSSTLDPLHAKQYRNLNLPTLDHNEIEEMRSADIFLMNITMWINDSHTQVHLRGLGDRGRDIILVACYEYEIYILVKKVLERIFPEACYTDNQKAAIAASEKLDSVTWDPDMDDDGEDGALEALKAM